MRCFRETPLPVGQRRQGRHRNDDSVPKSLFVAILEASKNWKAIHHWKPALQSFQVMFGKERVPLAAL